MSAVLVRERALRLDLDRALDREIGFVTGFAGGVPVTARRGRESLDDVIVGAWEGVVARRAVTCLVCGEATAPAAAHAAPSANCSSCGASLS